MSGVDEHELVIAVKNLAIELGRTPTLAEFAATYAGIHGKLRTTFGSYTILLTRAGLDTYSARRNGKKRALTNEIFERSVSEVLGEKLPEIIVPAAAYTPTLIIPDCHFPWVNPRVLEAAYKWASEHKPKRIIQVGDLYDMYAHSRFPKSLNIYMPEEEERVARAGAELMWKTLREICPDAECVQLKGNHDIRPAKQTMAHLPALEHVIAQYIDKLMSFDGVLLIRDVRQEYIVDGIEFIHGHYSRLGQHRDYAIMNAVCGHIHVGGAVFKRVRGQTLWELNAGLAGDPEAKALGYTPQKMTHWTPGFGWIDAYGPRFVPV